jgi:esterase FrsA
MQIQKGFFIAVMVSWLGSVSWLAAAAEMAAFKSEGEMVRGWYHRHEHDNWLNRGARIETVETVLHRIESAPGIRHDPTLVDTIVAYGPGNWVFEWVQAGESVMTEADTHKREREKRAAYDKYVEALTYFTIASWPHLGLKDDKAALALARVAYMAAGSFLDIPVKHIEFPILDTTTRGYLHLPKGKGPFPLLIFTHGSDVTKEDGLSMFTEEFERQGMAMLSVDLPGIGEASHVPLSQGSDLALAGAREYARGLSIIDQDKVFVAGASFGGNAAARYFFNHDAAGVISMCGPLHTPFLAPAAVFDQLPALTIDGVKSRLGILGQSSEALTKEAPKLSLKIQGYADSKEKIDTPLLIFTNNRDPVAPLEDLQLLESRASRVDKIVLDEVGHCPPRWVRQPIIARWVRDQIRLADSVRP